MSGTDQEMYGLDFHAHAAKSHSDSARSLAESPRDIHALGEASRLLGSVGTLEFVGVEFTHDEAKELLWQVSRATPMSMRGPAYKKLYKALAVEVGGGQHLPPELAPDGVSEADNRSERV